MVIRKKNPNAWTDLKNEKQLVKNIDKVIGDLIDENSENFEQLYDLMDNLAKHEYLKNNKHFMKVQNKVNELHEVHQEIADNRDVKLVHEERIEKYLNDVQEFFDKFVDDYANNIEPM